jgi:hypothetical protein
VDAQLHLQRFHLLAQFVGIDCRVRHQSNTPCLRFRCSNESSWSKNSSCAPRYPRWWTRWARGPMAFHIRIPFCFAGYFGRRWLNTARAWCADAETDRGAQWTTFCSRSRRAWSGCASFTGTSRLTWNVHEWGSPAPESRSNISFTICKLCQAGHDLHLSHAKRCLAWFVCQAYFAITLCIGYFWIRFNINSAIWISQAVWPYKIADKYQIINT